MMRVLVTGGAGFIGSHLVERLAKIGKKVYIIDNLYEGSKSNLEGINCKLYVGSICSFDFYHMDKMEAVFHLATRKMVHALAHPFKDLRVNVEGTLRVLEAVRKWDASIVYTSSGTVYGEPTVFPTPEDYPTKPLNPYGVSKLAGEEYCRLYHRLYGLRTLILRLFSVYGPKQNYLGVIPKFIKQALNGEPYTVWGNGEQKRVFTYVSDCVDGILLVAEQGESGETYNLGDQRPYSILELTDLVSEVLDVSNRVVFTERMKGDLDMTYPSIYKIHKIGWSPKVALREGLAQTTGWVRRNVV